MKRIGIIVCSIISILLLIILIDIIRVAGCLEPYFAISSNCEYTESGSTYIKRGIGCKYIENSLDGENTIGIMSYILGIKSCDIPSGKESHCIKEEKLEEPINEDLSNKYFTAFGTEPFWSIEISGGIAKLSSPMFETEYEEPVTITKEGENYHFKGEELEGEFILKDCIDGGKGDMHYYTVGVAKFREYYYEGCGDDEQGIKMSDEDIPEDYYQYQESEEETRIEKIIEEKIANGFKDIQSCMESLDQYQPERMPGDPQTTITVGCGPLYYGEVIVTGYIYTSVYPDLGIRITTSKGYNSFYEKSETPILTRDGNKISYSNDAEYIRVYEKSEDESLLDIINSKHLNSNCSAHKRMYEDLGNKIVYGALDETIYDIHYEDDRGRIFYEECIADDEATEPDYRIVRYFESSDKTKYYKMVFTDGCAPGPCSIFGEVELF